MSDTSELVFVVQLNDSIVAATSTVGRATKMATAVKEAGPKLESGQYSRATYVRMFRLDAWPEHWAGKEPSDE